MKKYTDFIVDSFVDYQGIEHHFVIASYSQTLPKNEKEFFDDTDTPDAEVSHYVMSYTDYDSYETAKVLKSLSLGISICNPEDEFNVEVGKAKALARAKCSTPMLFATKPGVINTTMVQALMKQEAEYLKNNPDAYIRGYAEAAAKYEQHQKDLDTLANLTDEQLQFYEYMSTAPIEDLDKVLGLIERGV